MYAHTVAAGKEGRNFHPIIGNRLLVQVPKAPSREASRVEGMGRGQADRGVLLPGRQLQLPSGVRCGTPAKNDFHGI